MFKFLFYNVLSCIENQGKPFIATNYLSPNRSFLFEAHNVNMLKPKPI